MSDIQLFIQNGKNLYYPVVEEGITWSTERKGTPGKLEFSIAVDEAISFEEGNAVRFTADGTNVFYGFIFTLKRTKDGTISVTAYDQLRYLKNKDTINYAKKTAGDFVKMIAANYNLNVGTIEDTGYIIASRLEKDKTLFDMIQNAIDLTLENTKKVYVLYDDFGSMYLKNIESMKLNILIDETSAEDYDYTSSIDSNTYDKIKLVYENDDAGARDVYISQDTSNINKWGVLQYFETIDEKTNGQVKADALLNLYNKKTKNLTMKNVFGDVRVRAGTSIIVKMNLGDISLQNYMIVEAVKHTFNNSEHTMDLTLRGGEFSA